MTITYKINGKRVSKKVWDKRKGVGLDLSGPPPMGTLPYSQSNPMETTFDGVMEHQVPDMRKAIKAHSIQGVEVRDDGSFRITSRKGRKRMHKEILGLHDKQGGYGDA